MPENQTSFDALTRTECLHFLSIASIGRVGISIDALPAILPVSYLLVDEQVMFRSTAGSKLDAIGRGDIVSFEVDHADRDAGSAWSVLVVGRATTAPEPEERAALDALAVDLWPPIRDAQWVRLPTTIMTGRRLVPA